jgi:hypothetical protein
MVNELMAIYFEKLVVKVPIRSDLSDYCLEDICKSIK